MQKFNKVIDQLSLEVQSIPNNELLDAIVNKTVSEVGINILTSEIMRRMSKVSSESVVPPVNQSRSFVSVRSSKDVSIKQGELFDVDIQPTKRKFLKPNEVSEIFMLLVEGESHADIAMAYNIEQKRVSRFKREFDSNEDVKKIDYEKLRKDFKVIHSVKKLPKEDQNYIRFLLANNVSTEVISTRFHVVHKSIGLVGAYMRGRRPINNFKKVAE